jgi:hypothetical protein
MAVAELKEAIRILRANPALWIPGIVTGALAASMWILYNIAGAFFTSRLLIIVGLILVFFVTGSLVLIKNGIGGPLDLLTGGARYYFRVLLPLLVVIFFFSLIMIVGIITLSLGGLAPDPSVLTFLTMVLGIPTLIMTLFLDTTAVFEDRRVFDAIRRSIKIVFTRVNDVIAFLVVSFGITAGISFVLMVVWEAALYDKLEPITRYTEAQMQAFTPDQLLTMIGPSGVAITAVVIFIAALLLVPILTSYKACFFRSIAGEVPIIQQPTIGEYDSKGRWYKY